MVFFLLHTVNRSDKNRKLHRALCSPKYKWHRCLWITIRSVSSCKNLYRCTPRLQYPNGKPDTSGQHKSLVVRWFPSSLAACKTVQHRSSDLYIYDSFPLHLYMHQLYSLFRRREKINRMSRVSYINIYTSWGYIYIYIIDFCFFFPMFICKVRYFLSYFPPLLYII